MIGIIIGELVPEWVISKTAFFIPIEPSGVRFMGKLSADPEPTVTGRAIFEAKSAASAPVNVRSVIVISGSPGPL